MMEALAGAMADPGARAGAVAGGRGWRAPAQKASRV